MKEITSSHEVKALISNGAQVLDVRSQNEFGQDAVAGAINLPLDELKNAKTQLDASKAVVVYCRTGGRSAKAKELLINQGFKAVHNAGSLANLS